MTTVFKLTGKRVYKDRPDGHKIQDMPESYTTILRTCLADIILETDDGLRSDLTEAEYEMEITKAQKLEHDICVVLTEHGCCYGTELTALLKIVTKLHFDMADIVAEKQAAVSVAKKLKDREA